MQNKSRETMNKKNKGEVAPSTIEVYLLARHKDFFSTKQSTIGESNSPRKEHYARQIPPNRVPVPKA